MRSQRNQVTTLLACRSRADTLAGKFLPTRRTPSISTSDLLERIVRGYRGGFFDKKLEKNGHPELMAADVDWDSSGSVEKVAARKKRAGHRV